MKHTALPWFIPSGLTYTITGPKYQTITSAQNGKDISANEAIANAAFIVHACNCHEELVKACQLALECVPFRHIRDIIEEALDNATK